MLNNGSVIVVNGIRRRVRRIKAIRGGLKLWTTVIDKDARQSLPPSEQGRQIYIMTALSQEADHATA